MAQTRQAPLQILSNWLSNLWSRRKQHVIRIFVKKKNVIRIYELNQTKISNLIQLIQTFADLAIARFPLASSSVPQRSALHNIKTLKLGQELQLQTTSRRLNFFNVSSSQNIEKSDSWRNILQWVTLVIIVYHTQA
jgi:hypothetical protein